MKNERSVSLGLALLISLFGGTVVPALAEDDRVVEVSHEIYYDGLAVTTSRLVDGRFVAYVSETQPDQSLLTRAEFRVDVGARSGELIVWGSGTQGAWSEALDFHNRPGLEQAEQLLEEHHVRSVGLWALLLWEDYQADMAVLFDPQLSCGGCESRPNGCSGGWLVPNSCAGASIRAACEEHDDCYQCGAYCAGTSRAQCDRNFRDDLLASTGSSWCAGVYFRGVRILGWLFYRNPNLRPNMGPDVYSLGIQMTACEGQYYGLCTIYFF